MAIGGIMPQPAREPVIEFCKIVGEIAADAVHGAQADHIVTRIVDETGYMSSIRRDMAEAKNHGDKDEVAAISTRLPNIADPINIAKTKTLSQPPQPPGF